jgi:predicted Ser/Thr protein kinase
MSSKKQNCWEYMKCGRQPGGDQSDELGICPAAADDSYDGINTGKNAGRFCWAVAGTFCGGKVQGTFADKRESCLSCGFFNKVRAEEGTANLRTKFLRFISEDADGPILKNMRYQHIQAGKRFITQGQDGDAAYIIQRGSCQLIVEKDGDLHPVGHRGEGDIVGVMAILTGEPRSAHVEAETDMEVWVLKRDQFENISREQPGLLGFLTELAADRFDSRRPIADRTIGKYVATDIIGRGGFSVIYKGLHLELNMPVAIKMMRHDLAMDPDFLNNFQNEAKTIASLNHENIVKVFDIEKRFRTIFLIMEYLDGESLVELLKNLKTIPPNLVAHYLNQICSGLQYAHSRGIIHRDINSSNIIVQRDDRLKILDFGLACPIGTEDFSSLGTLAYMAPEQVKGDPMDQRTDIYAVGITAYEMLVGKRPFPDDDVHVLEDMHLSHEIPDPAASVPNLLPDLQRFIIKSCQRDPNLRYDNFKQALADLKRIGSQLEVDSKSLAATKRKQTTLMLSFEDKSKPELQQLVEEFSAKVRKLGVDLTMPDLPED